MWRFKAGNVETAAHRVMRSKAHIFTPMGLLSPFRFKGFFARRKAQKAVREIVTEAESKLKKPLHWEDHGDVVFSEQASWGFQALQAYAKWLDLQDLIPSFQDPPDGNFYKHAAITMDKGSREFRFSHITEHCLYSGYFVPCRFDHVVHVEPFESWGGRVFHHSFGSAFTLAAQLALLEPQLPTRSRRIDIRL